MRLYLRDSERRPDPEPVTTDDRTAILTGLGLWIVGLAVTILVLGPHGDPLWTCITGVILGVALLTYAEVRSRKLRRD